MSVSYPRVDSLWDALVADWGKAGSYAKLIEDYLNAAVGSIPTTPALAASWTAALATALGNYTAAKAAFLDASIAAIPTTAQRGTDNALLAASFPDSASYTAAKAAFIDASIAAIPTTPVLTAHYDITEFEKSQAPATENAAVAIAITDADQSLGAKDITVDIPAGSTIISVIALARINIMNNAATAQKIDLKLIVEGVTLFSQTDVIGFGAVDGASGSYIIAEDATGEVTADAQVVTLEAQVTLSAAASVRFQAQYYLFITYNMG